MDLIIPSLGLSLLLSLIIILGELALDDEDYKKIERKENGNKSFRND